MPTTIVGQLQVLVGADSAQITNDMTKIRGVARNSMAAVQGDASAASRALGAIGVPLEGVGAALKGLQPAAAAAQNAMRAMGAETSAAVTGMTNGLASLAAGGFTPVGIALAAVSVGVSLLASQKDEIVSVFAATEERAKGARESLEKLRVEMGLLRGGRSATSSDIAIAGAEDELTRRRAIARHEAQAGLLGSNGTMSYLRNEASGFVGFGLIDNAAQHAAELVKEQERYVSALKETAREEKRIAEAREKGKRGPVPPEFMGYDLAVPPIPSYLVDIDNAAANRARKAATMPPEFLDGYAQDIPQIPRWLVNADNAAANRARRVGEMPPEFLDGYAQDIPQLTGVDLAIDEGDAVKRREDAQARIVAARKTMAFELAQIGRTETEQAVAAEQQRYAQLLEDAERYGADRAGLEKDLAAKVAAIRAAGAEKAEGPSMAKVLGDFAAQDLAGGLPRMFEDIARNGRSAGQAMKQFAADFAWAAARVAAQKALLDILGNAFGGSAGTTGGTGSGSYTNASSSYGADAGAAPAKMASTMRSMDRAGQALGAAPRGAARGGAGGQAGNIDATIVVRPPAVIADDVMAKSSPQARAAVVYSVMQRGGRRAERSRA